MDNNSANQESLQVRAGNRTYFLDIKRAKEDGKPFLVITESQFKGDDQERERSSIIVFPEQAQDFSGAVAQMVAKLDQ